MKIYFIQTLCVNADLIKLDYFLFVSATSRLWKSVYVFIEHTVLAHHKKNLQWLLQGDQ